MPTYHEPKLRLNPSQARQLLHLYRTRSVPTMTTLLESPKAIETKPPEAVPA